MLVPCNDLIGTVTVHDHAPAITTHRDVLYVPTGRGKRDEGLFDRDGKLIEDAGYFRSHSGRVSLYAPFNALPHDRFGYAPDEHRYVFLGALTGHYGHFITGSLARFWALDTVDRRTTRLVVLNHGPLSDLLAVPWIRDVLQAFGVDEDALVSFARPTRFREIIVPAPAFEEGHFAHRIFGAVCGAAGRRIVRPGEKDGKPVFLTKMHQRSGVSRIDNEDRLCHRLDQAGFEIVAPEALSFADQVRLFVDRPIVAGIAGSALHTAIFAPGRVKYDLHTVPQRLTNQALLDGANGGRTIALYPRDGIDQIPAHPGFAATYTLHDPVRTAEELLRHMDV